MPATVHADLPSQHHALPVHEVVLLLEADTSSGLTGSEAAERLERFGPNVLPRLERHGPVVRFLQQLHNPLIYVLLGAAAVALALGDTVDASVILGVVLVNAVIGFVQEERATQALESLVAMTRTRATVVRDGQVREIGSDQVVPGDLVVLEAGDKVPADLRLSSVVELRIDESALTGESAPVAKHADVVDARSGIGDRLDMAFSGTLVVAGQGRGVVVDTGADTEIGEIHRLVGSAGGLATPLTRTLARFSRWLTLVILVLAAGTFALGVVRGESAASMVTAAVALAVGAIPEGLPAAVTITLAIGVARMARRRAIIRKLPAAETLGSTSVICTDKTGTLTENRMAVQALVVGRRTYAIADDDAVEDRTGARTEPGPRWLLYAGLLCNDAPGADGRPGSGRVGDPTEVALVRAATDCGLDPAAVASGWSRVDSLPFSSERRCMVTEHRATAEAEPLPGGAGADALLVVKGAVEVVLPACTDALEVDGSRRPVDADAVGDAVERLSGRALRVLAVAAAEAPQDWAGLDDEIPDLDWTLLGLQAMSDRLRPDAVRAVATCRTAGIGVKMVTGDHVGTARAVAAEAGLGATPGDPVVVSGRELEDSAPGDLPDLVVGADVFARVSPEQKLRIVEALQRRGQVVAVTGDGVNDAPALKQADIGVAMGEGGTEVAKEAADMVLTDDDFATIEAAVEEGRGVFDNLTKFITWTLPTNLGEGLVILAAIVMGTALPILPVQILWINMTTAVALGLMLAFEPKEPGIMRRPPRDQSRPLLDSVLVWRILLVSALMLGGAFGMFAWARDQGWSLELARTLAVNTFVMVEIGYLFNCRSLRRSVWSVGLLSNRWVLVGVALTVVLQLLLTYAPFMNSLFGTEPMTADQWLPVIVIGVAATLVVGIEKWVRARLPAAH
ncbi:MAG: HAD-IC family P-type ATPase [Candidatus Nanopelagicales bacterium]